MNPSKINRENILKKFNIKPEDFQDIPSEPIVEKSDNLSIEIIDIEPKSIITKNTSIKLSIDILSRLPSNTTYENACCQNYNHKISKILNTGSLNFTTKKKIYLSIFTIHKEKSVSPVLLFLLYKNLNLSFPEFNISTNIDIGIEKKLDIIFDNYKIKPEYVGYKEYNNNIYIFYQYKEKYVVSQVKKNSSWWWATTFEIVNHKKIMNIDIDSTVYNIFIENPLIYSLFNEKDKVLSNGNIVFYGGHQNYISFISSLGLPKESPTSNLGPYYYFYSYHGAGRRAIWSENRKSKEIYGEDITQNEFGVYDKGGIVRFVIFGNNPKFLLNKNTDPEDDSEISTTLAESNPFIKSTLKIRDVDGKWAINHNIAYIGSTYINVDGSDHKPRRLLEQWAVRDYNQHLPLSYHYINTDEYAKIKDKEKAINMPYEYKSYEIE